MLRPYPIVAAPTYGFVSMKWRVPMSDETVREFTRRSDAESFVLRTRPALKAVLAASLEQPS